MTELMTSHDINLWWTTNLQRVADEHPESYGAALVVLDGNEVPCLCRRQPDEDGWYEVVAPGSWGPLFYCDDESLIKKSRRPDGVIEFWCHRSIMSPLRKWLEARNGS